MENEHRIFRTGFGEQSFEIDCNNTNAYGIATFLFADFPGSKSTNQSIAYDILSVGKQPIFSLWHGERQLYFGESQYQLAYILMNEVIYHCINGNNKQHALHSGAVCKQGQCILLSGASGKGKSTLTAWLIIQGYQYLTDELVFLSQTGRVTPLTRPISLKGSLSEMYLAKLFRRIDTGLAITEDNGSMIPHRLLNPQFSSQEPSLTHILFPEYKEGAELQFEEISPAKSSLYLIQSHVNARNLIGHGIAELSNIVRRCKSYKLVYGGFDDLDKIFNSSSSPLSQ